jgi:hypothetical protein
MTRSRTVAGVIVGLVLAGTVAVFAVIWRPAIPAIDPPPPGSFDVDLVKRGRHLAAIGNCGDCHTVRGGKAFAGGLPVSGQVVNPDGLINQIEGAILQSMSWTFYESVSFDNTRITSIDWQTYPILRFNSVPDSIEVHIINRPGHPFLGSGETGQGPAAASIANAIANATGKRLRELPLTRKRIKDAIEG